MELSNKTNITIILVLLILSGLYSIRLLQSSKSTTVICNEDTNLTTEAISLNKTKRIDVKYISFNGKEKILQLNVIDVIADDVLEIFRELKEIRFPLYTFSCYAPRTTIKGKKISLHAYAAAIDINYLMNPFCDVINQTMIPTRKKERQKDEETMAKELKAIGISKEEIKEVLKVAIQPEGSDDRFLNRSIVRKGMVTQNVVDIFKKHGFNIWGGNWRQPIDHMHFQIPRQLAEQLAKSDFESRKKIWEQHKKRCISSQNLPNES